MPTTLQLISQHPAVDLVRIAEILLAHGVAFIVVEGQAETIFGSARVTVDIDLCYRRTKDNLERLAAALQQIKPTLRNAPKDLPFVIDEKTLALGNNFAFDTPFGDLHLLGFLEPLGDYEAISKVLLRSGSDKSTSK